jgi:multidrug transporter EmrE-like cation transporter
LLVKTALLALISVAVATLGQLLLKSGMSRVGYVGSDRLSQPTRLVVEVIKTPQVWLGLGFFGISAAVWLVVLSRAPLSFAYPFAGLTYVLITLFSRFALHEHVAGARWAGILLIVAGIILVARTAPPGLE